MSITVNGTKELIQKLTKLQNADQVLKVAVSKTASRVEREASKQAPVDTGKLRGSISKSFMIANKGTTAIVKPNVRYAKYVHEGTGIREGALDYGYTDGRVRSGTTISDGGGIRPNKFMKRARDKADEKKWLEKDIKAEIKKLINS
jgi:HK97 gp10 family phage protein